MCNFTSSSFMKNIWDKVLSHFEFSFGQQSMFASRTKTLLAHGPEKSTMKVKAEWTRFLLLCVQHHKHCLINFNLICVIKYNYSLISAMIFWQSSWSSSVGGTSSSSGSVCYYEFLLLGTHLIPIVIGVNLPWVILSLRRCLRDYSTLLLVGPSYLLPYYIPIGRETDIRVHWIFYGASNCSSQIVWFLLAFILGFLWNCNDKIIVISPFVLYEWEWDNSTEANFL